MSTLCIILCGFSLKFICTITDVRFFVLLRGNAFNCRLGFIQWTGFFLLACCGMQFFIGNKYFVYNYLWVFSLNFIWVIADFSFFVVLCYCFRGNTSIAGQGLSNAHDYCYLHNLECNFFICRLQILIIRGNYTLPPHSRGAQEGMPVMCSVLSYWSPK